MDEINTRSLEIPIHKIKKLKSIWTDIYTAIVEYGELQIRFDLKRKSVDLRACEKTKDIGFLDRGIEFLKAVLAGFKVEDSIAILKYKDVFMDKFDISEIRKMKSNHLQRAIGRVIGRNGKTKEVIENTSRCKFLLQDQTITLLGVTENINIAKDAIGRLIQGAETGTIFNRLSAISTKLKNKYGSIQTIYENLKTENE
ncbi:PNO1 [Hepatospora eriocheir]|uniref:Pre-rRNA-processing protein PNO1 n=1 Tax=Hepatospora eriocheir TaxID=1081669 RepID=A0A1X0QAJ7_9MICR|nr:PNO1 [Hepatospora eriocheir]